MQFLDERGQAVEGLIHSVQLVAAATSKSQKELWYQVVCPAHSVRLMTEAEALAAMAAAQGSASALQQFLTELRGPVRVFVRWCVRCRSLRAHCPCSWASVGVGQVAAAIGLALCGMCCQPHHVGTVELRWPYHELAGRNTRSFRSCRSLHTPQSPHPHDFGAGAVSWRLLCLVPGARCSAWLFWSSLHRAARLIVGRGKHHRCHLLFFGPASPFEGCHSGHPGCLLGPLPSPCSSDLASDFLLPSLALWTSEMRWNLCPPHVGAERAQQRTKGILPTHYFCRLQSHIGQGWTIALFAANNRWLPLDYIKISAVDIGELCKDALWHTLHTTVRGAFGLLPQHFRRKISAYSAGGLHHHNLWKLRGLLWCDRLGAYGPYTRKLQP